MAKPIKKVGIILKPKNVHEFVAILPNFTEWLKRRKVEIYFALEENERLHKIYQTTKIKFNQVPKVDLYKECELLITLGGDGTLIGVSRKAKHNTPPIFGINMGTLGFITEFSKHDFYDDLAEVLKGNFETRKVPLFCAEIFEGETSVKKSFFINDAVVSKGGISRMFTTSIESEEETIYHLAGDGLIISSPIGSTAYSLAAGGPIIHPDVKGMILTPICPHSLTYRPMVLSDSMPIFIKFQKGEQDICLTLDGQEAVFLSPGQKVKIVKSPRKVVQLVVNKNKEYFRTLKDKFKHGKR